MNSMLVKLATNFPKDGQRIDRSNCNKQDCKTDSDKDQMALSRHYSENHGTINKPPLHEAYTVTFVEQPSCHSLDICENKWYHLIDAQINIQNIILPHVK